MALRSRVSAMLLACVFAAGCAPSSPPPTETADAASSTGQALPGPSLVEGITTETRIDNNILRPVAASWPQLEGEPELNSALTDWVERQRSAFDAAHPVGAGTPELNLSWEIPLATTKLVAVRMTSRVVSGGVVDTSHRMFYADRSTPALWSGTDLVRADRLDRFTELANDQLTVANALADGDATENWLLGNPRFERDGSLTLQLSWPQDSVAQGVEVRLTAAQIKPLLSGEGRTVAKESRVLAPKRDGGKARSTSKARGQSVDCQVKKCVALTFDDGPGEHTEKLLDELKDADVPVTFFVLGQNVRAYPKLIKRMVADGHQVANHTYDHQEMTRLSPDAQRREVARGRAEIVKAGGPKTQVLRPPYGAYNKTTQKLGAPLILWDVDTLDWQNRSKKITTNRALGLVRPGSIILAHDIHYSSVRAAPGIVKKLKAKGYTLVTVNDLLGKTKPGKVYKRKPK